MSKRRPVVGIAVPTATSFGREIVQGIMRFANSRRLWVSLEDFEGKITRPSLWAACDGFIATRNFENLVNHFAPKGLPIVCCTGTAVGFPVTVVCADDTGIARLGAEHLLDCKLEQFAAYCPRGLEYSLSARRLGAFQKVLKERQYDCAIYTPSNAKVVSNGPSWSPQSHWPHVIRWLKSLPKPVGILCTDDSDARELAAACQYAGIAVPDQVAVLGVNNDALLCESAWPPISSVDANFEQVGYTAASMLDRLLSGEKIKEAERITRVPPVRVVRRASTDLLAIKDPDLSAAIRFIREHACDPCTVDDVVENVAVARRWLELQFTEHLGRTPHEEIRRARLNAAYQMLAQPEMKIQEIAGFCGFTTIPSFHRFFRHGTGESPAAWRRKHRQFKQRASLTS